MICLSSFSKFSDVFPAFNCVRAFDNRWSICLGVNILSPSPYFALYLASDNILEQSLNNLITFSCDQNFLILFIAPFCSSDLFLPFTISFRSDLIFFLVLCNHPLYFYKNLVDLKTDKIFQATFFTLKIIN